MSALTCLYWPPSIKPFSSPLFLFLHCPLTSQIFDKIFFFFLFPLNFVILNIFSVDKIKAIKLGAMNMPLVVLVLLIFYCGLFKGSSRSLNNCKTALTD